MNTATQPIDALALATKIERLIPGDPLAAELRRLVTENEQLRADLEAIGAGGIGPLMAPASSNHVEQHLGMAPAGWKLVPVEPTPEMLDAGRNAREGRFYPQDMLHGPRAMMTDKWAAMLAAAPSAPAENSLTCRKQLDLQKTA